MAHVLNGCMHHLINFYKRRHDRVVEIIASFLKEYVRRNRICIDKHSSTVFPSLADKLNILVHKKSDIHVINHLLKKCFFVEITVCYDLYLEYAFNAKVETCKQLVDCLTENQNIRCRNVSTLWFALAVFEMMRGNA